ncbi:MAG: endonuclease III [Candidatus Jacksonbacteria bacterium RIFCSPHIGHO2_12_FULL_44_12]|nr:MAG: endonuclease III [Candidatus Jacksonbacteria bacterium RIFCSPHIGHO2_12_FULL_44_12]
MDIEKQRERKIRARKMLTVLRRIFPDAKCALFYSTPLELLIAVMLSAQCTDKKVNEVTTKLFKKYRSLSDYALAQSAQFEKDIQPTGFYRNKAKHILKTARVIKKKFHGKVPDKMADLLTLPGVARKTANVVLGNAYGIVEGIAVDTHVRRFTLKFDLSDHKDSAKIEHDLMEIIPKKEWFLLTFQMIEYGRQICRARKHNCAEHPLTKIYPPAAHRWPRAQ